MLHLPLPGTSQETNKRNERTMLITLSILLSLVVAGFGSHQTPALLSHFGWLKKMGLHHLTLQTISRQIARVSFPDLLVCLVFQTAVLALP